MGRPSPRRARARARIDARALRSAMEGCSNQAGRSPRPAPPDPGVAPPGAGSSSSSSPDRARRWPQITVTVRATASSKGRDRTASCTTCRRSRLWAAAQCPAGSRRRQIFRCECAHEEEHANAPQGAIRLSGIAHREERTVRGLAGSERSAGPAGSSAGRDACACASTPMVLDPCPEASDTLTPGCAHAALTRSRPRIRRRRPSPRPARAAGPGAAPAG